MKIFLFLAAGFFAAISFGDDVVKVHRLTVEESLAAIEVINVTAEKALDETARVDVVPLGWLGHRSRGERPPPPGRRRHLLEPEM